MADVLSLFPLGGDPEKSIFGQAELVNDLLPGGEGLDRPVRVGEHVWNLSGHVSWRDKQGTQTKINFGGIPDRFRSAAKDLAILQMNPALAATRCGGVPIADWWSEIQEPTLPVTALANIKMLTHGFRIVEKHGIVAFDLDDWDRLVYLLVQPVDVDDKRNGELLSPLTGRGRAQQFTALWQVCQFNGRTLLGNEPPFGGRESVDLFRRTSRRNASRPHEDVGNVLGFAAWFFDNVAEDVVAHLEWWAANAAKETPFTQEERYQRMLELLSTMAESSGGVLPASANRNGGTTLAAAPLARLIGVRDADEAYLAGRWARSQLGKNVRLSFTFSPCPLPISTVPLRAGGSATWAERLLPSKDELDIWQRRLVYLAMYYLSATVMLRDSQLAVLALNAVSTDTVRRPDGTEFVQHRLAAYNTKNRHVPTPTSVAVNGRIASIWSLLLRLQVALDYEPIRSPLTGVPVMFDHRLATPLGKSPRVDSRAGAYLDQWFLKVIKEAASELHERGALARNLDDVSISMRQVRITCAQAYAIREHGEALAAAFGQWDSKRVMAGYVGEIHRLITPLDPSEARDIAREDVGRRLVSTVTERDLSGRGVTRLRELEEREAPALKNSAPLTPARLRSIGKRNPHVEQGPLSLCIFHAEGAMCGGKGKADFRLCWPGQCRNSVMTVADRARYELMRRQYVHNGSPVSMRAAAKMQEGLPQVVEEFAQVTDAELRDVVKHALDDYVRRSLEDRA
jgi:hypothetical protein